MDREAAGEAVSEPERMNHSTVHPPRREPSNGCSCRGCRRKQIWPQIYTDETQIQKQRILSVKIRVHLWPVRSGLQDLKEAFDGSAERRPTGWEPLARGASGGTLYI